MTMRSFSLRVVGGVATAAALLAATAGGARAQFSSSVVAHTPSAAEAAATLTYWTPARLASAKPMELHPSARFALQPLEAAPNAAGPAASRPGDSGSDTPAADTLLYYPAPHNQLGVEPEAWFGEGYFTESRVSPADAAVNYPFRTIGLLFFHDPRTGGNFLCSASTISERGIATAGHCVYNGAGRYFYTNWLFVPASSNGSAPYSTWGWSYAITTSDWVNGGGNVPNAHDFAIIQAADHGTTRVGAEIGWLGWYTLQISSNHLTMLGYPCNLDNCALLQRNDAQTYAGGGNNTWIYGSSMRGGASGGPWVRDFGVAPAGNPTTAGGNWVTAVTSYGPIATNIGYLGASQFDSVWISTYNTFCAHHAGNC